MPGPASRFFISCLLASAALAVVVVCPAAEAALEIDSNTFGGLEARSIAKGTPSDLRTRSSRARPI